MLELVFEARVFNGWLQTESGRGLAAVVSEDGRLDLWGGQPEQKPFVASSRIRYILWGGEHRGSRRRLDH
ncbi:MAG: hypothetical protein IRZ19_13155, partial [Pyrinomonas methylaliphatogenes]|nr:hypothetical protein [Pyrinomonas methylaliphatogenes]